MNRPGVRTLGAGLLFVVLASAAATATAADSARALRGMAIETRLDDPFLDASSLDAPPLALDQPAALPLVVYLSVADNIASGVGLDKLEQHLAAYSARHMPVVLALGPFPSTDAATDRWRATIQSIARTSGGRVAAYEVGEWDSPKVPDVDRYAYLLKLAAVSIRAIDQDALIVQGTVTPTALDWQARVYAAGVAPYEDVVALAPSADPDDPAFRTALDRMLALVEREDPTAQVVLRAVTLPDAPARAAALAAAVEVWTLGTRIAAVSYAGPRRSIEAALAVGGHLADLLTQALVALDDRAASLRFLQAGADVTGRIPHRLLYSPATSDTFLVYWGAAGQPPTEVELVVSNASAPAIRDPVTGSSRAVVARAGIAPSASIRIAAPMADSPLVIDFNFGTPNVFAATAGVRSDALPRIDEIIVRYQEAQAAQDAVLHDYIAHVRIEQHFRPSPADPAYNVITENRLFSDRGGVEWEELSFEFNGAKWTSNRPAFPLVQPEKALSLPLDLRLGQDYAYALDGVDTVDGHDAFVVTFQPRVAARGLYRGTVWIDRRTFVRVKIHAAQTRLAGPVVSNDETQLFAAAGDVAGRAVWLPIELRNEQVFLIAGRTVLVERVVHLSAVQLNVEGFDGTRAAARAGNRVMYRDTQDGVRYLVKRGDTRVVSNELTTSAKAFALGADIDPSFDIPLPIGGLNILDFNFLKRDMQLALLFGGVIAAGNIQHPNLWGGKFDASLDFFGFALKSNDDLFDQSGKRANERVNRIPVSTGLNLGYQIDPFEKITAHYEFKYDAYFRDAVTAPDFVVPGNTVTHGEGLGYEYRRAGYSFAGNAAAYQRMSWAPWGETNAVDFRPDDRTYLRYDAGVSKDFIIGTFHTFHLNGTYFSGSRLDRFSMYQFGLFDATRMHGVPAAVRFGELGMARGSYSFNLFEQYRVDLFLDYAKGRDPQGDNIWQNVLGTGVRVNLRAPHSTILQVDAGHSVLPEAYRGAGSFVLQVLLLKPL